MGIEDIDLEKIDPNNPTDEELDFLSGGVSLRRRSLSGSARRLAEEITIRIQRRDAEAAKITFDPDLIPDTGVEYSEDNAELDRAIDGIDILDAYAKWCGKMVPDVGGKRESIMISCPIPGHVDNHPSAFINLDKQTWFCAACQRGGDKFDIAALARDFDSPGYKTDGTFPELRRQMAGDFGFVIKRSGGKTIIEEMEVVFEDEEDAPALEPVSQETPRHHDQPIVVEPEPDEAGELDGGTLQEHPLDPEDGLPVATISPIRPNVELSNEPIALDWESIIPENTYLHEYMTQTCKFDIPHEFHFWLAMQTIAFANGFDMRIDDVPFVNGNLYLVLVGPTGLGKSRATYSARKLVRDVMPWTGTSDMPGTGVKMLGGLESGQALINGVSHEYDDPAGVVPGAKLRQDNIRGWSITEEFAGFVKRAMRMGSDFKERAIEFYDVQKDGEVASTSMKHGEILTKGPFLQITSTTQSEAVHAYLSSEDVVSGFLNRFMFAQGPCRDERPARWTAAHAPDLTRSAAGLKSIVDFADAHADHVITYSANGDAAWDHLYREIDLIQKTSGPMSIRLDLMIKKCLLLFCLNEHKTEIDADLVNRMEPIMKHMLVCMQNITGDLYWRPDDDCQDAIIRYVQAKNEDGKHPRKRDIIDAIKRPMKGRSRFEVGRALELLEKVEILQLVQVDNSATKGARGPKRHGYKVGQTGQTA